MRHSEERGPEHLVLAVADVDAEHLPVLVGGDAGGDHDGAGDDPVVDPGLGVGGVEVHVGEGDMVEAAGAEHRDLFVDAGTDPRHRRLRHSGLAPERPDQVVDLPGARAGGVGGHDHAPQSLIDPPAGLEQGREERPDPDLRDPQLDVAGRSGQQPGPGPVALVRPGIGSFVRGGADHRGQLGVDQLLHARLEQPAEQLLAVAVAQSREQVSNSGIIVMGHRVGSFQ